MINNLSKARTAAIFLFAALVYLVGASTRAAIPGMVFDKICLEFGWSASQTALISSFGVFGCMTFIAFSGLLTDRFGWKAVILPGALLQVAGEYFIYSSTSPALIYLGSFINGGGRTIGYLALMKLINTQFKLKYFSLLIGVFYLFSYGGTMLGTSSMFSRLENIHGWQSLIGAANNLTLAFSIAIGLFLLIRDNGRAGEIDLNSTELAGKTPRFGTVAIGFFREAFHGDALKAVACTSTAIMLYWSFIAVASKKFLDFAFGGEMKIDCISLMNVIVMIEMIFGGAVSFVCGNRRNIFRIIASSALFCGFAALFASLYSNGKSVPILVVSGYAAIGIGYGLTCVQITAVREYVSPRFAASIIAFANFIANIGIMALSQYCGMVYDFFGRFSWQLAFAPYIAFAAMALVLSCRLARKSEKAKIF